MAELKKLVGELLSLNAENLAQRCLDNSDVEWCLSELKDMLAADMEAVTRCKDCKHVAETVDYDGKGLFCAIWGRSWLRVKPGDFFKRREEGT